MHDKVLADMIHAQYGLSLMKLLPGFFLLVASSLGYGQLITVDFNTAGALAGNFNQNPTGTNLTQSTTGGTGVPPGSGSVQSNGTQTTALYTPTSLDLTTGSAFSLSMDFHKGAVTGSSTINLFTVGMAGSNNAAFTTTAFGQPEAFGRLQRTTTANTYAFNFIGLPNTGSFSSQTSSTFSLADTSTDWYRLGLTLQLTDAATSRFTFTLTLWDLGADGTSTATSVSSYSSTFVNTSLKADSSLFTGFRVDNSTVFTGGDNFVVAAVPEPSVLSLLLLSGAGLFLLVRRNRSTTVNSL